MSEENVEIVLKDLEYWNRGDMDAFVRLWDDEVVLRAAEGWPERVFRGKEAVRSFYEGFAETVGRDSVIEDLIDAGDVVVTRMRAHMTGVQSGLDGDMSFTKVTTFRHGRVFVEDAPERGVSFHELAARAVATLGHPIVGEMTTTAAEPEVTAYCAQVAEVEVDPDTGQVTVHRIVTAHDVGTIINPLDHQGQIDGAVMQGLGYALMEGLHADEGRITTLSLGEVKIPTMQDIPTLITVLVESPGGEGPFQGKAIGENPISPVAPAIANAVYDAVGVRIQDLPITAEKVRFASHP